MLALDVQISLLQQIPQLSFCDYDGGLGSIISNLPEGAGGVLPGIVSVLPPTGPPLEGINWGPTPMEVVGNLK